MNALLREFGVRLEHVCFRKRGCANVDHFVRGKQFGPKFLGHRTRVGTGVRAHGVLISVLPQPRERHLRFCHQCKH